jgi:hypothetical protein
MALHLIKLCVGCDSVGDLEDWIRQKRRAKRNGKHEHIHRTRMVPKRADELTDGGSLYWVIRGEIACRQRILDVRPFRDKDGVGRCALALEPKVVLVELRPHRAFQGWRYLIAKDAPRDLAKAAPGAAAMPEKMRRELRELGLM